MKSNAPRRWLPFARSNIARFVALAFLGQFLVNGGILLFVQQASKHTVLMAEQNEAAALRDDLLTTYRAGGTAALRNEIGQRLGSLKSEHLVILFSDRAGAPLAGNLSAWPVTLPDNARWHVIELYRIGSDSPEPIGAVTMRLDGGQRLLAGVVMSKSQQLADIYEEALTIAFLISLLLTLAMAVILGRILARQVSRIAATTSDVAFGALDRRVETDGSGDAFDRLAGSINAMLERIGMLVGQLRMMTDGLAHDLKSPVTRLVSVIEQASTRTNDEEALDALENVRREAEALHSMLSTALLISRTEAGFGTDLLSETNIGDLLRDIAEIYGPLVEESGFALAITAPDRLFFPLHRELVSRSLANLIENALKYAEGGDRIELSAKQAPGSGELTLAVSDNGPGIPTAQRAQALRRFGRLDPARGRAGSGLGLALVEAMAKLHHGNVELEDNDPGLRVRVHLRRQTRQPDMDHRSV